MHLFFFPPPCGDGGGFTALLSNDLPDVPLNSTQLLLCIHCSGFFWFIGLGASVTVKRYTAAACKILSNETPSPEQLVSAVALSAGWLESSWLPFSLNHMLMGSARRFVSPPLLLSCVLATPPPPPRFNNLYSQPVSWMERGVRQLPPPNTARALGPRAGQRRWQRGRKKVGKESDRNPPLNLSAQSRVPFSRQKKNTHRHSR